MTVFVVVVASGAPHRAGPCVRARASSVLLLWRRDKAWQQQLRCLWRIGFILVVFTHVNIPWTSYIHDIRYNWRQKDEYSALLLPLKTIILLLFDKNIFVNCKFFVCTLNSAVAFHGAWVRSVLQRGVEWFAFINSLTSTIHYLGGFSTNAFCFTRLTWEHIKYPILSWKNM